MWAQEVEEILPKAIRALFTIMPKGKKDEIQEIRIRLHQPLEVRFSQSGLYVSGPRFTTDYRDAYICTREDCMQMLQAISNHSIYAIEEQLRQGYVTVAGGHRVGMTGKVIAETNKIRTIQNVTSFNIRIARQVKGIATHLLPMLYDSIRKRPYHTLIVSPPQCGKTTLLRDVIREMSLGNEHYHIPGHKVAVVDERSEIAGSINGVPQCDLGPRTDVLDACPKVEGMMLLIRSMSPQIIAVDEIGTSADALAIDEVIHAGVQLITTVHAHSIEELLGRPTINDMLQKKIFERYVVLGRTPTVGTIIGVYDKNRLKLTQRGAGVG
ncbi:stage III sporulation protein AA [Desulfuribacillus stibiiarsenatis]|uniref:Stage III sporulation protein AA n=1 Tax=Desulfuribacillus stibiiarsenatis TaxID=1390249 RepID=A0A1E5L6P8_9FIRM|nr:stage III sporulation protein AA [Desulfuribacillus stibiiarsenatis]OEH85649.1 stage III sporulation protein AA [Desulfuribacillus stibiiarsenatis]